MLYATGMPENEVKAYGSFRVTVAESSLGPPSAKHPGTRRLQEVNQVPEGCPESEEDLLHICRSCMDCITLACLGSRVRVAAGYYANEYDPLCEDQQ
jgi:hypothetical protein